MFVQAIVPVCNHGGNQSSRAKMVRCGCIPHKDQTCTYVMPFTKVISLEVLISHFLVAKLLHDEVDMPQTLSVALFASYHGC